MTNQNDDNPLNIHHHAYGIATHQRLLDVVQIMRYPRHTKCSFGRVIKLPRSVDDCPSNVSDVPHGSLEWARHWCIGQLELKGEFVCT